MLIVTGRERAPFDPAQTEAWWFAPTLLFDGETLQSDRALRISAGRITDIVSTADAGRDGLPVWRSETLASPGFFDVQANGGGGVLFNAEPTAAGLRAIVAAHRASGTTALLPTLITDTPDIMERAVGAVLETFGCNGIAGMHLEGPHISVERKGAHNPAFIRPMDEHTFSAVRRLRAAGVPVLLTLAPECVPPGAIAALVALGAVVSLGHTAASAATTRAAIAEGARCVTHLYNAMTPIASRDPGVVGVALDSDIYCGFIADGYHVDDTVLRLAIRSRPVPNRMVLVSDAMPTWNGPDHFTLYGETIRLESGKLVNATGSLAGAHIDMGNSVKRLVSSVGLHLDEALRMATSIPARMMGLAQEIGFLKPGMRFDAVLMNDALKTVGVFARD